MIRIMENDDAEQNEPLSKFTTLPERISVRLHKQLMPGEVIEFTLRSVDVPSDHFGHFHFLLNQTKIRV